LLIIGIIFSLPVAYLQLDDAGIKTTILLAADAIEKRGRRNGWRSAM
jgi:hypothetical protein